MPETGREMKNNEQDPRSARHGSWSKVSWAVSIARATFKNGKHHPHKDPSLPDVTGYVFSQEEKKFTPFRY
jgi:hypothetical protein